MPYFGYGKKINVAYIAMLQLLLRSAYTVSMTFQLLTLNCQCESLQCTKICKGTAPGKLSQTAQQDFTYYALSCPVIKLGELGGGAASCSGTGWASVVSGEQLRCASLYLSQEILPFSNSLPSPTGMGVNEWLCGTMMPEGLNRNASINRNSTVNLRLWICSEYFE